MTTNKPTIAVIGLGNIGSAVTANLVKGNRTVFVADKTMQKATDLAVRSGSLVKPMEIDTAVQQADIIVTAIYFNAIKEFILQYGAKLAGKIIIDPSNPIAPDEKGGFKKIIGEKESAGQLLSGILPAHVRLVKALGTLGVASLAGAAYGEPRQVLFYANEDRHLDAVVEELIHDSGFDPIRVGGIDQSIRLEVFGDLHEFGALGKTVTLAEAKTKL